MAGHLRVLLCEARISEGKEVIHTVLECGNTLQKSKANLYHNKPRSDKEENRQSAQPHPHEEEEEASHPSEHPARDATQAEETINDPLSRQWLWGADLDFDRVALSRQGLRELLYCKLYGGCAIGIRGAVQFYQPILFSSD